MLYYNIFKIDSYIIYLHIKIDGYIVYYYIKIDSCIVNFSILTRIESVLGLVSENGRSYFRVIKL